MVVATEDFAAWLDQADIPRSRLTPQVRALLLAVFRFRHLQGSDYFSTRLLAHFLLHCDCRLKVAHVARLLGISRPTASGQQNLSSKEVIQQAHHRLRGLPYGKLLPRYAGAIAAFLVNHPDASRAALLDFIQATFGVRVSRIALYKFLKKYGLDRIPGAAAPDAEAGAIGPPQSPQQPLAPVPLSALIPGPVAAPPFSSHAPSTPVPSC
jgi:hypothetical protein